MKSSDFIHDKQAVNKTFETLSDGSVITKNGCRIFIPKRFVEKGVAEIGSENYSLGLFPIVNDDNKFTIVNAISFIYLKPNAFDTVVIDNEDYIQFTFNKNNVVIKTLSLVQKDTLVYNVFNEMISGGRIPWYFDYIDSAKLLDTASTIAGTSIGKNPELIEILIAIISRQKNNKMQFYRHSLTTKEGLKNKPAIVPLKSVTYSATNTTNKLAGAYFDEGVTSALINPTTKPDSIGTILRK